MPRGWCACRGARGTGLYLRLEAEDHLAGAAAAGRRLLRIFGPDRFRIELQRPPHLPMTGAATGCCRSWPGGSECPVWPPETSTRTRVSAFHCRTPWWRCGWGPRSTRPTPPSRQLLARALAPRADGPALPRAPGCSDCIRVLTARPKAREYRLPDGVRSHRRDLPIYTMECSRACAAARALSQLRQQLGCP